MPLHLFAHNDKSEGAKQLADALGIRRIKHQGSKYVPGPGKTIINWGSTNLPAGFDRSRIINRPACVAAVCNKLSFFRIMREFIPEARVPEWTDDPEVARGWVRAGRIVCARTILNGHSGNGLVIIEREVDFVRAPLYTIYVPKKDEFRLHFAFGELIDFQRKAKREDYDGDVNWKVRSHDNGFVFVRGGVQLPADVTEQATRAFRHSGLDFGAVDVIFNERQQQAYVLEINTAPGLSGQTVDSYVEAFRRAL